MTRREWPVCACNTERTAFAVLHDINMSSVRSLSLMFDFEMIGRRPFRGCLHQGWVGTFNKVIRIGDEKPLELELQMVVSYDLETEHPREGSITFRLSESLIHLC